MALDPEVEKAVREAAKEMLQSDQLVSRMLAWLTDMSERELTSPEENQHLDNVRKAVRVPNGGD